MYVYTVCGITAYYYIQLLSVKKKYYGINLLSVGVSLRDYSTCSVVTYYTGQPPLTIINVHTLYNIVKC